MRHIDDSLMSDIGLKVNHDHLYLFITVTLYTKGQESLPFVV